MHFSSPSGCRLSTCRPWKRGAVGFFSSGYCSVLTFLNIVEKVTPKPLMGLRKSLQLLDFGPSSFAGTARHLPRCMLDRAGGQLPRQRWHREATGESVVRVI